MKTLFLEKRGMDFYKGCREIEQVKDFNNFRYCGYISKQKQIFLEMTIHSKKKSKYSKFYITDAYLNFSFENKKGCFADLQKSGFCQPTEKDVLNFINIRYNRHFKNIKIVDDIEKI